MQLKEITVSEAHLFLQRHRPNTKPTAGAEWALGLWVEGQLKGVAVVGPPPGPPKEGDLQGLRAVLDLHIINCPDKGRMEQHLFFYGLMLEARERGVPQLRTPTITDANIELVK